MLYIVPTSHIDVYSPSDVQQICAGARTHTLSCPSPMNRIYLYFHMLPPQMSSSLLMHETVLITQIKKIILNYDCG